MNFLDCINSLRRIKNVIFKSYYCYSTVLVEMHCFPRALLSSTKLYIEMVIYGLNVSFIRQYKINIRRANNKSEQSTYKVRFVRLYFLYKKNNCFYLN